MPLRTAIKALVVCVLLASLTTPGLSHADSERSPRAAGPHPGRFLEEEYAERLGLEAETLTAIHTIVEASRLQSKALWAELHQAHAQMHALLSQETPDPASVMRQADTIGALELAERKNRLQAMLQIRTLLTPAQRQELIRLQGELSTRRRLDSLPACQADSVNLCPDAAPGRARIQCLRDHLEALSETCRDALQTHRGERHGP
jgi:Spy/CpxP family protein refolding chaperone